MFRHDPIIRTLDYVLFSFPRLMSPCLTGAGTVALAVLTAFGVGAAVTASWLPPRDLLAALLALAIGLWVSAGGVLVIGWFSVHQVPWVFALAGCWVLPA